MSDDNSFRFAASTEGAPSLHADERLALLAVCVANQQAAGFRDLIDLREFKCPLCQAPGFNTGWGFTRHTCGAEPLNDEGGTLGRRCEEAR